MATREMKRRSQNFKTDIIRRNLTKEFEKRQKERGRPLSDAEQLDVLDSFRTKMSMAGDRGDANARTISAQSVAGTSSFRDGRFSDIHRLETEVRPRVEEERKYRESIKAQGNPLGGLPAPPPPDNTSNPMFDEHGGFGAFSGRGPFDQEFPSGGLEGGQAGSPMFADVDFRDILTEADEQGIDIGLGGRMTAATRNKLREDALKRKQRRAAAFFGKGPYEAMRRVIGGTKSEDREFLEQQERQRQLDDDLLDFMGRMRSAIAQS